MDKQKKELLVKKYGQRFLAKKIYCEFKKRGMKTHTGKEYTPKYITEVMCKGGAYFELQIEKIL